MVYHVGIDLDQTIGDFNAINNIVIFLQPELYYNDRIRVGDRTRPPSPQLRGRLNEAFNRFIDAVALEAGGGMLRPGILQIMEKIVALKETDVIDGISIYSNNSNMGLLIFASRLLEKLLGKKNLFDKYINGNSPLRFPQDRNGKHVVKTLYTLKDIFYGPVLKANQYLFFDDLIHENIRMLIPDENYFKVNPYHDTVEPMAHKLSRFNGLCYKVLDELSIIGEPEYLEYISDFVIGGLSYNVNPLTEETLRSILLANKYISPWSSSSSADPFIDDTDIILNRLERFTRTATKGGKRKRARTSKRVCRHTELGIKARKGCRFGTPGEAAYCDSAICRHKKRTRKHR